MTNSHSPAVDTWWSNYGADWEGHGCDWNEVSATPLEDYEGNLIEDSEFPARTAYPVPFSNTYDTHFESTYYGLQDYDNHIPPEQFLYSETAHSNNCTNPSDALLVNNAALVFNDAFYEEGPPPAYAEGPPPEQGPPPAYEEGPPPAYEEAPPPAYEAPQPACEANSYPVQTKAQPGMWMDSLEYIPVFDSSSSDDSKPPNKPPRRRQPQPTSQLLGSSMNSHPERSLARIRAVLADFTIPPPTGPAVELQPAQKKPDRLQNKHPPSYHEELPFYEGAPKSQEYSTLEVDAVFEEPCCDTDYSTEDDVDKYLSSLAVDPEMFKVQHEMPEHIVRCRQKLYNNVRKHVMKILPEAEFKLFGSMDTGLSRPESDIDVQLLISEQNGAETLRYLRDKLSNSVLGKTVRFTYIPATIPLLKCLTIVGNVPCTLEISCNKPEGSWNSQIVKQFLMYDRRVLPCLFFVNYVFYEAALKNGPKKLLSAFMINVTFIYYLQSIKPQLLPYFRWMVSSDSESGFEVYDVVEDCCDNNRSCQELVAGYFWWISNTIKQALITKQRFWVDIRSPGTPGRKSGWAELESGLGICDPIKGFNLASNLRHQEWNMVHTLLSELKTTLLQPARGGTNEKRMRCHTKQRSVRRKIG